MSHDYNVLKESFGKHNVSLGYRKLNNFQAYPSSFETVYSRMVFKGIALRVNGFYVGMHDCRELVTNILRNTFHGVSVCESIQKEPEKVKNHYIQEVINFYLSCKDGQVPINSVEVMGKFAGQPLKLLPAILKLNEIERQFTDRKSTIEYVEFTDDVEGKIIVTDKPPFNVSLSDYWYKSPVHFSFALCVLKNDYWSSEKFLNDAFDFVTKHDYVFEGIEICWPIKHAIKRGFTYSYEDCAYFGCWSFANFLRMKRLPKYGSTTMDCGFYPKIFEIIMQEEQERLKQVV